jgi:hypothetical protein
MAMSQALRAVVNKLPERLNADFEKNAVEFGGKAMQMNQAGADMIANLKNMWTDVASTGFPPQRFDGSASKWISSYVEMQSQLYAALNEPDGPGTGGTIVSQLIEGDIIDDLQRLIARTVKALISSPDSQDEYVVWASRWAAGRSM